MNDDIVFVLTSVMVGQRFKDKQRVLCGFICSKQNRIFFLVGYAWDIPM